jgi:hypothetical protein
MTQIQVRRGLASEWTAANTVLAPGEIGYETDTGFFKIGKSSTPWRTLSYATSGGWQPVPHSLTIGSGITGSTSLTFNGSADVSVDLPSTIARSISGNAATANKFTSATTGKISGTNYDGSAPIVVSAGIYGASAAPNKTTATTFSDLYVSPSAYQPVSPKNGDLWVSW